MEEFEEEHEVQEIIEIDREEADNIIARRHSEATDAGYDSARKKFKLWLSENYPRGLSGVDNDDINDRNIILPLDRDSTLAFLGQVQRLKLHHDSLIEIPGDQPPIAVSTMTNIGSALSDLYKSRNMSMSHDLKSEINKFMKGYKRMINTLKQNGIVLLSMHIYLNNIFHDRGNGDIRRQTTD